jgi:hypothetical protein
MTVRISDKLTTMVIENISSLYRKKLEELDKQKPDVGDRIYELVYGPHRRNMELLPKCFFRRFDSLEVGQIDGVKWLIRFKLSATVLGAYMHPENENVRLDGFSSDRLAIFRTPQTEEIIDAILEWKGKIQTVGEVRMNAQGAVKGILKSYVSLPPAIKAFPPLIDLLSPEVRKKVDVPQHKLTSVEMELNPHLKQLATDIALNKFFNR